MVGFRISVERLTILERHKLKTTVTMALPLLFASLLCVELPDGIRQRWPLFVESGKSTSLLIHSILNPQ